MEFSHHSFIGSSISPSPILQSITWSFDEIKSEKGSEKMLTLEQATRFYERLAQLIGRREGVEIKVKVTPRPKEEERTVIERRGNGKTHIKRV